MVIKKTVAPPPKGGSSVHKPRIPQKKSQLTIDVSIKDTEVFKDMIAVVSKIIMDERMPDTLRDDAMEWLYGVGVSAGSLVSGLDSGRYPNGPSPFVKQNIIVLCDQVHNGERIWQYHKHKFNPNVRVKFIGQRSNVDGLRPDKVVLLQGYKKSVYGSMVWLNQFYERSEVIDLSGE